MTLREVIDRVYNDLLDIAEELSLNTHGATADIEDLPITPPRDRTIDIALIARRVQDALRHLHKVRQHLKHPTGRRRPPRGVGQPPPRSEFTGVIKTLEEITKLVQHFDEPWLTNRSKGGPHMKQMKFAKFPGNWPKVVAKDAKYAIRTRSNKLVVSLVYEVGHREKVFLATTEHDELVKMVNSVKKEGGGYGGVFYINEWRQVLVPVQTENSREVEYYYAGDYYGDLEFDFEGRTLSGRPLSLDGTPLQPGDEWDGPHVGIPYKLCAGGRDIGYTVRISENRSREVRLSDHVSKREVVWMADKIASQKGWQGGRFYVNEYRTIFAPVSKGNDLRYVYIGQLEESDPWFPKPEVEPPSE